MKTILTFCVTWLKKQEFVIINYYTHYQIFSLDTKLQYRRLMQKLTFKEL